MNIEIIIFVIGTLVIGMALLGASALDCIKRKRCVICRCSFMPNKNTNLGEPVCPFCIEYFNSHGRSREELERIKSEC